MPYSQKGQLNTLLILISSKWIDKVNVTPIEYQKYYFEESCQTDSIINFKEWKSTNGWEYFGRNKSNRLPLLNIKTYNIQRYSNPNSGVCIRQDIKAKGRD